MPISLRVLAGRDLVGPDGRTLHTLLVQPKRFGLLSYLLIDRPHRMHRRDELLAMFWPDYREENARNALSQALSFIRRSLGEGVVTARGSDEVGVDRALFSCDAVHFEEAVGRGDYAAALSLYERDLLEGFHLDDAPQFGHWLDAERHYLCARALTCVRELIAKSNDGGDTTAALAWAARGAALAPLDESIAMQRIVLQHRLGNRAEALRAFDEFSARLTSDLGVPASPALVALVGRIRSGEVEPELQAATGRLLAPSIVTVERSGRQPGEGEGTGMLHPFRRATLWIGGAIVVAGGVGLLALDKSADPAPQVRGRFAITLDDSVRHRSELSGVTVALSPDGSKLAYVGGNSAHRIYIRDLDQLAPRPLDGTEGASNPTFSPDGNWIAFVADRRLKRIAVSGGPVVAICDSVTRFTWGPDDVIVVSRGGGLGNSRAVLWSVSAAGGSPVRLTTLDTSRSETLHTWPSFLPDGRAVLFDIRTGALESTELAVLRLADRKIIRLGVQGANARYVPSGQLVFGRLDGTVFAVPFDAGRYRVTGAPIPVMQGVVVKSGGAVELSVSRNGTMAYVPQETERQLVLVDRHGQSRELSTEPLAYSGPRVAPDAKRLAVTIGPPRETDVYIYDIARHTRRRITSDARSNGPSWTPDGERVAWHVRDSVSGHIEWQQASGGSAADTIVDDAIGGSMSPTGAFYIAWRSGGANGVNGIDVVSLGPDRKRRTVTPNEARQAKASPDGRWIAYTVGQTQSREVYVQPLPGPGGAQQISIGGGTEPVWSSSGRELFYRANGKLMSVTLAPGPAIAVVRRDTLFDDIYWSMPNNNSYADYDVTPDGRHFVFVARARKPPQPIVVFSWFDELRARLALASGK